MATHGKKACFKIQDSSTTTRAISAWLTNVSLPRDADTAETTVFTSTDKTYIPGCKSGTLRLEGIYSSTVASYLHGILGKEKGFWYWPTSTEGTAAPHYVGDVILNAFEPTSPVAGAVTFTAGGQITGAVTLSTTS